MNPHEVAEAKAFFRELSALCRAHGLSLGACDCCNGAGSAKAQADYWLENISINDPRWPSIPDSCFIDGELFEIEGGNA